MSLQPGKKRAVKELKKLTDQQLYHYLSRIEDTKVRAYAAILYLTGGRCREILGLRRTTPEGKLEKDKRILAKYGRYQTEPLRKGDIEFTESDGMKWMLIHNVPTLKLRDKFKRREIPVPYENPLENKYYLLFKEYYDTLQPTDFLFSFTRQYGYAKIKEATGGVVHQHYFRRHRNEDLVYYYSYGVDDLMTHNGWVRTNIPFEYVQSSPKKLMSKMSKYSR